LLTLVVRVIYPALLLAPPQSSQSHSNQDLRPFNNILISGEVQ